MRTLRSQALVLVGTALGVAWLLAGARDGAPRAPADNTLAAPVDADLAHAAAPERASWARILASGGTLEVAQRGERSDGAPTGRVAAPRELVSLGPLSAAEKAPLYEEEIRRLDETRIALEELASSAVQDAVAHRDRLELRSDELRMLATLELLDADEYWVFAEGAVGPALLGRLVGRFGARHATKDGRAVQVVYPYAEERFPLLAELVPARRAAEEEAARELELEFNGFPEERRALYRDLLERPDLRLAPGTSYEALLRRYQAAELEFDPQTLTMSRR